MPKHHRNRFSTDASAVRARRRAAILLLAALLAAGMTAGALAFRTLVTELAVSNAQDAVILAVNNIVKEIMTEEGFDAASLVNLERGADGRIVAVSTNIAAVNTLAARVLERAVARTEDRYITVSIPLGNMTGSTILAGKGPAIPVQVLMLSSSVAGFRSEMSTAGINQTRHQILLDLTVQISLLMPWRTVGTSVDTEILVSETVIVGAVPESYWNWSNANTGG